MVWRILRRRGVFVLFLLLAALGYWLLHPHAPTVISVGYVADRSVILWNTLAQVRQPVGELHYGDRLEILREEGPSAQVRASSGTIGWLLDSRQLMDSELWGQSASLLAHAQTLPVQAQGHTKTVSNVRVEPGRNGKRVFQFMRGTPVVVLERTIADASPASDESSQEEKGAAGPDQKPKQEDWLLIMRSTELSSSSSNPGSAKNSTAPVSRASGDPVSGGSYTLQPSALSAGSPNIPIAGWVLARFVELDLPGPVRDNASSADLHVIAWFELNRVPNGSGGAAPQYLVAGSRGGEGQACDFTILRVYTWSAARKRYETAYVESNLCGRLPIRVSSEEKNPAFHFAEAGENAAERNYIMQQTAVRRVKSQPARATAVPRKKP